MRPTGRAPRPATAGAGPRPPPRPNRAVPQRAARGSAQRIRGDRGLGAVVLAPVEEDPTGAQRPGHARHHEVRVGLLQRHGQGARELRRGRTVGSRQRALGRYRHVQLHSLAPGQDRLARQRQSVQHLAHAQLHPRGTRRDRRVDRDRGRSRSGPVLWGWIRPAATAERGTPAPNCANQTSGACGSPWRSTGWSHRLGTHRHPVDPLRGTGREILFEERLLRHAVGPPFAGEDPIAHLAPGGSATASRYCMTSALVIPSRGTSPGPGWSCGSCDRRLSRQRIRASVILRETASVQQFRGRQVGSQGNDHRMP